MSRTADRAPQSCRPAQNWRAPGPPLAMALLAALLSAGPVFAAPVPRDTLDVESILARRSARLDSLLRPLSIAPADPEVQKRIEALDAGGAAAVAGLGARRGGLRVSLVPGRYSAYNRVEGSRPGVGFDVAPARGVRLRTDTGYAIEPHRWVGEAALVLGPARRGPALLLSAGDRFVTFGPTTLPTGADFLSLVAGQDRRDYLRRRGGGVDLLLVRHPRGSARIGAYYREDLSAPAGVSGHLFGGGTPIEAANPAVDEGMTRGVRAAAARTWRGDQVALEAEGGLGRGDFDFAWQEGRLVLRPILPDGGILHLEVAGRNTAGAPPFQEEAFLGGDATLRGYDRLEFSGRRRATARLEYETGVDVLKRIGLPLLRSSGVQLIPFVDAGTTWGGTGDRVTDRPALDGALRSSFGIGLRRDVWLPGVRAVRLDVARRADGSGDWGAWFRFLPYDFD